MRKMRTLTEYNASRTLGIDVEFSQYDSPLDDMPYQGRFNNLLRCFPCGNVQHAFDFGTWNDGETDKQSFLCLASAYTKRTWKSVKRNLPIIDSDISRC